MRQITDNPEALAAWLRYVEAIVARYGDVVDEWEVWNEPYGQADDYATLFYETAKAVRKIQPQGKIYCAAIGQKGYAAVLEKLKKDNALELGSLFIYHPYGVNPDANYCENANDFNDWPVKPAPLRRLVKSYSPGYDVYQGESGCPAQLEFAHALDNVEWTEYSQAKWALRRSVGDAALDIPSSIFTSSTINTRSCCRVSGLSARMRSKSLYIAVLHGLRCATSTPSSTTM